MRLFSRSSTVVSGSFSLSTASRLLPTSAMKMRSPTAQSEQVGALLEIDYLNGSYARVVAAACARNVEHLRTFALCHDQKVTPSARIGGLICGRDKEQAARVNKLHRIGALGTDALEQLATKREEPEAPTVRIRDKEPAIACCARNGCKAVRMETLAAAAAPRSRSSHVLESVRCRSPRAQYTPPALLSPPCYSKHLRQIADPPRNDVKRSMD